MAEWLRTMDDDDQLTLWHYKSALQLIGRGFRSPGQLDGLRPEVAAKFSQNDRCKAMLAKAVRAAGEQERVKRARFAQDVLKQIPTSGSAMEVAGLCIEKHDEAPAILPTDTPRANIARLATSCNADIMSTMESRAMTLQIASRQGSKASTASGLRAWHEFAVAVLGYPRESTLPPKSIADVLKFVSVFRCAGTAANYVGAVAWGCRLHDFSLCWHGPQFQMALVGLKKLEITHGPGCLKQQLLLDNVAARQLVSFCTRLPEFRDAALLFLMSWQFLFRVQSEAIPLQAGNMSELHELPAGRHSAVVLHDGHLHVRLRKRKNRPGGSLMSRPCSCFQSGGDILCAPHGLAPLLKNLNAGDRLFHGSPAHFLALFRRALSMLQIPNGEQFGFKAFRAGRATQLAKEGKPVHVIM